MYLSRIQLNPARRGSHKLLGSPQAMHAAVLCAFPHSDDEQGRVLWRIDRDDPRVWLYVVSRPRPDFEHLVEQAGWPNVGHGWESRDYQPLLDRLEPGQRWAFRLTANPTRATRNHGRMRTGTPSAEASDVVGRSRRYGHVTVEQQLGWLTERADRWGFALPDGGAGTLVHDRAVRRFGRQGKSVTIATASYSGVLEVGDADRLRDVLVAGAGPSKAYGCGLLTLAPVR
jgi:CRISPR system Cascade subunit CasE